MCNPVEICINIPMRLIELFENHSISLLERKKPFTQEDIQAVKDKWDEGKRTTQISKELGFTDSKVNKILAKYYPDRLGKRKRDEDTVELIKIGWDGGKTPAEIAIDLGLDGGVVTDVLKDLYPNRANKRINYADALTDQDKDEIVTAFRNGSSPAKIAKQYGLDPSSISHIIKSRIGEEDYNAEQQRRRTIAGLKTPHKITPEMLEQFIEMYRRGQTPTQLSNSVNNRVLPSAISAKLQDLPNWKEIRADHDRFAKIKGRGPATTNKTRAGKIDNLQSKGQGNKSFHGQYPSKQYN